MGADVLSPLTSVCDPRLIRNDALRSILERFRGSKTSTFGGPLPHQTTGVARFRLSQPYGSQKSCDGQIWRDIKPGFAVPLVLISCTST